MTIAAPGRIAAVAPTHGCHDCKFAHITRNKGECRANPPQAFLVQNEHGQMTAVKIWPPISPGDFCLGGWKLKLHRPDGAIGPS